MTPHRYFFDMDGTITESRRPIQPDMVRTLTGILESGRDVVVVSGAEHERIETQIGPELFAAAYVLAQNGNHARKGEEEIWKRELHPEDKAVVLSIIDRVIGAGHLGQECTITDTVEDRGCQISFSLVGHNAPIEKKCVFDPDGKKRQELIERHFAADLPPGVDVKIGGTTCLDLFRKDGTKGNNIKALIEQYGWEPHTCMYFGDALFENGNDESVIGVIPTRQVAGPHEVLSILRVI